MRRYPGVLTAPTATLEDFQSFLLALHDPAEDGPIVSPRLYSAALHIDLQTLAEQAKVHRNTVTRAPDSKVLQDYLRDSLRVISAATDLVGDIERALFWYRNEPLSAFEYRTAEQLVSEGRTGDLIRYVTSLEAGFVG